MLPCCQQSCFQILQHCCFSGTKTNPNPQPENMVVSRASHQLCLIACLPSCLPAFHVSVFHPSPAAKLAEAVCAMLSQLSETEAAPEMCTHCTEQCRAGAAGQVWQCQVRRCIVIVIVGLGLGQLPEFGQFRLPNSGEFHLPHSGQFQRGSAKFGSLPYFRLLAYKICLLLLLIIEL